MTISANILDLEKGKFVECPTDSNLVSVRTKICQDAGETVKVEFGTSDSIPKIVNLTMAISGTEYSELLENGLKKIMIRVQSPINSVLQFSFVSGESNSKFITIPANNTFSLDGLNFNSKTLYIQSNKNNTIVEILQIT